MVNGVVDGAVAGLDRRESESKGCDVFYPFGLTTPGVDTCCGASIEVATNVRQKIFLCAISQTCSTRITAEMWNPGFILLFYVYVK
jgi:hypothetical protein